MKATKFPRLLSRRSDGGLQVWDLELEGNKYRVTSGMIDGKHHTNAWTECKGKNIGRANSTTPEEQAALEAQALFDKKTREGYRQTAAELKTTGIFEPMLAKKFEDYSDDLAYPVYSQPKLDGIRCIADARGTWTRSGKKHTTLEHIEAALKPVFDKYPDLVLDGEAYGDKLRKDFSRICSLVKRVNPTAAELKECAGLIYYHVYDCVLSNKSASFDDRSRFLHETLKGIPGIVVVDTTEVKDRAQLDSLYEKYIAAGQEGQMVRVSAPYENHRSKTLLKRKTFDDAEFTIMGMEEGTGNRAGTCGAMMFKTPVGSHICSNGKIVETTGVAFKSNVKGTWEFVEDLWQNRKKYMGKLATVKYFGLTPGDKVPRFPYVIAIRDGE
jgi:DNA ligase-1